MKTITQIAIPIVFFLLISVTGVTGFFAYKYRKENVVQQATIEKLEKEKPRFVGDRRKLLRSRRRMSEGYLYYDGCYYIEAN